MTAMDLHNKKVQRERERDTSGKRYKDRLYEWKKERFTWVRMREAHGNKRQTQSKTKTHLLREKLKGQFQMTNMKKTMNYRETDRQTRE